MRKGFIFSLDAAIALAIVIIAIGVLAQQQSPASGGADFSENLHKKALDRAVTGFYSGESRSDNLNSEPEYGECAVIYSLNMESELIEKWSFCEKT